MAYTRDQKYFLDLCQRYYADLAECFQPFSNYEMPLERRDIIVKWMAEKKLPLTLLDRSGKSSLEHIKDELDRRTVSALKSTLVASAERMKESAP